MKKILAAIDGSENSQKVAAAAVKLANSFSADLTLISVATTIPATAQWTGTNLLYEEIMDTHRKKASDILEEYTNYFKQEGLEVETIQREGEPAEEICRTARGGKFDLVIVGTQGLGRVKGALLGSNTNYIVHLCKTPVFVAR